MVLSLWSFRAATRLRFDTDKVIMKPNVDIPGYIFVTLTVAITISLSSFLAFWATTRSDGLSSFTSEFDSAQTNLLKSGDEGIPSVTTKIGDGFIPHKCSSGLERIQVVKRSSYSYHIMKIICWIFVAPSNQSVARVGYLRNVM
jgi:hypothetical protein